MTIDTKKMLLTVFILAASCYLLGRLDTPKPPELPALLESASHAGWTVSFRRHGAVVISDRLGTDQIDKLVVGKKERWEGIAMVVPDPDGRQQLGSGWPIAEAWEAGYYIFGDSSMVDKVVTMVRYPSRRLDGN
jgi:hypothetical protein